MTSALTWGIPLSSHQAMTTEQKSQSPEKDDITTTMPYVDWQTGKQLYECLQHVFTSGIVSDVTFLVGENNEKVSAHKLILLSRSPVFYAMFEGPLAEKGEITIPDIEITTFRSFLRYLYTDKIDLTIENVVPVLNAAMKYCVDILIAVCEEFIINNVSVDNVCLFLEKSHLFHIDKLKNDCLQLIYQSAPASLRSQPVTDLCSSCLKSVMESDQLDAEESDIYFAIVRWADAQCSRQGLEKTATNRREILGDMLFFARFNTMDLNFLLQQIFSDGILTSDLAVNVVNYQLQGFKSHLTCRRRVRTPKTKVKVGPGVLIGLYGYDEVQPVQFQISCRAVLHGIGSSVTIEKESTSALKVFEERTLLKFERELPLINDSQQSGEIIFASPLFLQARKTYTVVEMPSARKKYRMKGCDEVVSFDKGVVHFSKTKSSETSANCILYLILTPLKDYGC